MSNDLIVDIDYDERRLKRIYINEFNLIALLIKPRYQFNDDVLCLNNFSIPELQDIDFEVKSIYYDYSYQAWCAILYYKEWPEVPLNETIPLLEWYNKIIILETRYVKELKVKDFLF